MQFNAVPDIFSNLGRFGAAQRVSARDSTHKTLKQPDRSGIFSILLLLGLFIATPVIATPVISSSAGAADLAETNEKVIVAFGDSLTAGYGLPEQDSFTAQLKAALSVEGVPARVINAGVSGDTSAGGAARIDWALADKPDILILELGANDGLRGVEPSETKRNLDAIITRTLADGVPVLFTGMLAPRNLGADYANEFDAMFPDLAQKHDVIFYPFFLEGVAADPSLNQSDGIHPNKDGVAVIVKRILPSVLKTLEVAAEKRRS